MQAHCPGCGLDFNQPRNEYGAGYAKKITRLSPKRFNLLTKWLNYALTTNNPWLSKKDIAIRMQVAFGTVGGATAEFKTDNIIENKRDNRAPDGYKSLFRLDMQRASAVVNAAGNLDVIREVQTS